jgi:peptidoglycan/xylan/chitin deacetylase (PgdA/CDA1 family)
MRWRLLVIIGIAAFLFGTQGFAGTEAPHADTRGGAGAGADVGADVEPGVVNPGSKAGAQVGAHPDSRADASAGSHVDSRADSHAGSNAEKQTSLAELRKKFPELLILHGPGDEKKVALTFDDAPDAVYTRPILEVLRKHNVEATFFLVGYRAEAMPDIVAEIDLAQHAIGNHSYNHPHFPDVGMDEFIRQVERTQQILHNLIGYRPRLFRPPYGAVTEPQLTWAVEHDFTVVNWNVDSLDWKSLKAEEVSKNILDNVRPGAIVLQHAGGGVGEDLSGTVRALPHIIRTLKAQGYTFVTVPELLGIPRHQ